MYVCKSHTHKHHITIRRHTIQLLQRQFPGSVRVQRLVGMQAVRACVPLSP